jgi:hypothetical protein
MGQMHETAPAHNPCMTESHQTWGEEIANAVSMVWRFWQPWQLCRF